MLELESSWIIPIYTLLKPTSWLRQTFFFLFLSYSIAPPDDSYSRTALGSIYHQIAIKWVISFGHESHQRKCGVVRPKTYRSSSFYINILFDCSQFKKSDYSSITPDPTLPSSSVALAQAGKYYREALRIDPTNWHAGNGIAVLLAQQGLTVRN